MFHTRYSVEKTAASGSNKARYAAVVDYTSIVSVSDCPASVSLPDSHEDWVSSIGLREPEEMDDEDPIVHSSSSEW